MSNDQISHPPRTNLYIPNDAPPTSAGATIIGYPPLSDFIGNDAAYFIFRRFNTLAARNLLYMQDELSELEENLCRLDRDDFNIRMSGLGLRRYDTNDERKLLMKEIEGRLGAYQNALLTQSSVLALEEPSSKLTQMFADFMNGRQGHGDESRFPGKPNDLVSLLGGEREKDPLELFIERRWAEKLMRAKEKKLAHPNEDHPSPDFIRRRLTRLVAAIVSAFFLMGQLVFLYHIGNNHFLRFITMGLFSCILVLVLAFLTESSSSDIFTSLAAYFAVTVVFVAGRVPVDEVRW